MCLVWPPTINCFHVLYLFWHLCRTPLLSMSRSVSYYRQTISLWCIRESACHTVAQNQLPNLEMWVTYGPKWVWKRMLISRMLLSASEGVVAYVCERMYLCMCMVPYVATLSRGACQDVLHQQLEETNCAADTVVGRSPSSHPVHTRTEPFCNNLVWWTRTSSSITPDHSHSFRGHCVQAYCKCNSRRRYRRGKKKSLEKLQDYRASAIVEFLGRSASVCVSHLSLVCGGGWVRWEILDTPPAPRHLSHKSSVPLSFSYSLSSPIGDIQSPHPLWVFCLLITIPSSLLLSLFHNFPLSLSLSLNFSQCSSHPQHPHLSYLSAA